MTQNLEVCPWRRGPSAGVWVCGGAAGGAGTPRWSVVEPGGLGLRGCEGAGVREDR